MPKVIQIRDVPDDVHDALTRSARHEGLSLTRYVVRELEQLALRPQLARENAAAIRRSQRGIGTPVDRATILAALHDGRGE